MERRRAGGVKGQAVPLIAVIVLAAGGAAWEIGRLGEAAVQRAKARTAADAAALAGAARGEAAARTLAVANHGRVIGYRAQGSEVEVVVTVGRARAVARARRDRVATDESGKESGSRVP